ncbi:MULTISPECIES: formyltetrahydrofolate deformylase [Psychrobacter]|jgi:formyltetrahydrofolate deformylase|uniref:Formyltetrahydrofolate deformylase n=1 Tax=Psychrobacter pocilloporae TaxID=1775882 RepID=A0ABT6IUR1_9GAMM|nr:MULTISPECIES: formyltetrahydrofolate deformylase [Psychrobacter]AOY44783.1 formyltetrahydrofolate deformylase [Psychrobacter sp. AntiMn-1]MDH4905553.1 formyltetrahydrofolate deformylase [Psychrobacter pocilloporae]MED6316887.1 formyltetrahydrofolate deformylase [Pseudomonadota bacterium]|tara:strand:- start:1868 stop:2797 length:930 start_codon:yes stop_codon:yes gene_type:complete
MSDNTKTASSSRTTNIASQSKQIPSFTDTATLLIKCKDQAGIVQAVSEFIHRYGANIITLDQYSTAHEGGQYFMRLEFALAGLSDIIENFEASFAHTVAKRHNMDWRLHNNATKTKVGILVSKFDHALLDLLWRHQRGLLDCEITCVVSNHPDLQQAVENFGITFHHVPVTKENKVEAEEQIHKLMAGNDLLVLARYMQILSADFVKRWPMQVINIHHSFLPAFVGADPYRQAYDKGVKLIGATAHYVTAELDQGPIIEQDVHRVTHRQGVTELRAIGRDIERNVLARAVNWHVQNRVIVAGNKTVVFN